MAVAIDGRVNAYTSLRAGYGEVEARSEIEAINARTFFGTMPLQPLHLIIPPTAPAQANQIRRYPTRERRRHRMPFAWLASCRP